MKMKNYMLGDDYAVFVLLNAFISLSRREPKALDRLDQQQTVILSLY
jgi:hypothetical protein